MLTDADVCMLTYADRCWRMLKDADGCWRMLYNREQLANKQTADLKKLTHELEDFIAMQLSSLREDHEEARYI